MLFLGLLPYATFFALFLVRKPCGTRENLLYTSLIWGCFIALTTECLSVYRSISCTMFIVIWAIILIATILACARYGISWPIFRLSWRMCLMIGIVSIPLAIGLIYPPNTWDSMTYHLPRVEHWLQNGSLAPYPTAVARQNVMAPFAEICLLNLRALSGDDFFYNTIQWVAYINCIVNVSLISKLLGAQQKGQWFAALICSAIPMAILQASSTQNDLVASWWLSSLAALTLLWLRNPSLSVGLGFGCALGLACLSKGTSYPIALPFVIVFAIYVLRQPKKYFLIGIGAAFLALTLNFPTYKRNIEYCGNMIGGEATESNILVPTPKNIFVNIIYNIAVNIELPPPRLLEVPKITKHFHEISTKILDKIVNYFRIDKKKFFPYTNNRSWFSFHEDTAQNTLHTILLLFSLPIFFFIVDKVGKIYGFCVICSFVLFSSLITYQPWVTRLQLPIFILSSSILSLVFCHRILYFYKIICTILVCSSILTTNLFNMSRPILSFHEIVYLKKANIKFAHNYSRDKAYFANAPTWYTSYTKAIESAISYRTIGFITGGGGFEYMLWKILRKNGWTGRIIHITENNREDINCCDIIFMLDTKEKFGFTRPEELNPYVIELH